MSEETEHVDVVIIGGGPGGEGAALYGSAAGLKIAVVEKDKMGGTCLHRGCIPAKRLLETAATFRHISAAADFGITVGEPEVDMAEAVARKQKVVDTLHGGLRGLLKRRKADVHEGVGWLRADGTVGVRYHDGDEATITADNVILAAGSVPRTIPGFEVDGRLVMTSDELLEIDVVPRRAAVIGGGAIGCEFASMLGDLGAEVTILEALDRIVPGCDPDVTKELTRAFAKRGIDVSTGVKVSGHTPSSDGSSTTVHIDGAEDLEVDLVVVSVGRRPYSDGLLEEGAGIELDDRGYVKIDEWCRTSVTGVYAIGDLVPTAQLAHIGYAEAMLVIRQILGEPVAPIDYDRVPWCIYTHPEVAFAGLTEEQATERGFDVVASKHKFSGNGRAMIVGETEGLVKVIAERGPDGSAGRLLGVHMMGPWVTEQLGQGYLAVNWEATVDEVSAFIQPHPTMSELFGETVLGLTGRGMHS